jgi:hypothetical protein
MELLHSKIGLMRKSSNPKNKKLENNLNTQKHEKIDIKSYLHSYGIEVAQKKIQSPNAYQTPEKQFPCEFIGAINSGKRSTKSADRKESSYEKNFQLNQTPSFKVKSDSYEYLERLSSIKDNFEKTNSNFFSFDLDCKVDSFYFD